MKIIHAAIVTMGLLAAQLSPVYADSGKCVELREALKRYETEKESWVNASVDTSSFSRKTDVLPIVKKLAKRREELQEERAVKALMNLKSTLSSVEIAKDWKIPNYEGIGNYRNVVFFSLAADVVCMGG